MQELAANLGPSAPRRALFTTTAFAVLALAAMSFDVLPAEGLFRPVVGLLAAVALGIAAVVYLFSPFFSAAERARARGAYGSHRDVLANGITAVAIGQLVFLPLLLFLLSLGLNWPAGASGVWQGMFSLPRDVPSSLLFLALVGLDAGLLLVVYIRLLRTGSVTGEGIGFTTRRLGRNVGLGLAGWVAMLVAVAVIRSLLLPPGSSQLQPELKVIGEAPPAMFFLLFGAGSLLAPFAEEVFFRGYMFGSYAMRKNLVLAYLSSTVVFALLHLNPENSLSANFVLFLSVVPMGLILAYLYRRGRSLVAPLVAHGLNNTLAFVAVYLLSNNMVPQ